MKLDDAILAAYEAHDGQYDKSGVKYITHPLRVMRRVLEGFSTTWTLTNEHFHDYTNDEDYFVVAVLHDVLEDTNYVLKHLNFKQDKAMAHITRHFGEFNGETYKEYIYRCCNDPIARLVKYHDLQDNLSPTRMSYLDKGQQKGMTKRYEWSLDYIRERYAL